MKYLVFCFCMISGFCEAQEYVDVLRIGYGQTLNNDFEGTIESTKIRAFEASLTYPVVLNESNALITGVDFGMNALQLFPNAVHTNLYTTTLKIGWAKTFNDTWSGTFVLLPKVASDYRKITGDDFYVGGFALLKRKKNEHLTYRYGIYGSMEAFGFFTVPIFGWYYLSPNERFEMDMSLPISADINYRLGDVSLGMDYVGIGRSFNVNSENAPKVYVDFSSLEFATYAQLNLMENSVLVRGKLGYSTNSYEVYADGEKIGLGLAAFSFGDDRTQLNPNLNGSLFFKLEAIYRFHISDEEKQLPITE